jgi:NAD(P)-dependent dehydrogenase (short-subunit alcohol dehydrogenase family)
MAEHTAAVVTGAASGIGRELARALAGRGRRVHLVDVASTEELADELGGVAVRADVAEPHEVEEVARGVDADFVCLNAGIVGATLGSPWEVPPEEWEHLLRVNLGGVVNGLRAFVPRLLEAGRPAHILVTASLAGLVTFPAGGGYAATKHAVVAVAEQAALALADTPVTVTVLCPALVRTGMSGEGADPAEVAAQAVEASLRGRFLVVPDEWSNAVVRRATRLVTGEPPEMPSPGG